MRGKGHCVWSYTSFEVSAGGGEDTVLLALGERWSGEQENTYPARRCQVTHAMAITPSNIIYGYRVPVGGEPAKQYYPQVIFC